MKQEQAASPTPAVLLYCLDGQGGQGGWTKQYARVATVCAGLMVGPALLGWIADMTSVQVALQANAAILVLAVLFFALQAREPRHLRNAGPIFA